MYRNSLKLVQPLHQILRVSQRFENGSDGSGTVKSEGGVFSDREAAMENRYFREKAANDLKRLKEKMEKRKKKKGKEEEVVDDEEEQEHDKRSD